MKRGAWILLGLIVAAIIGIGYFIITFLQGELLEAAGWPAMIIFFFINVLEVVIAPIPGGIIGYLGAAVLGFSKAWVILYVTNLIGATIVFFLARRIGKPYTDRMIDPRQSQRYKKFVEGNLWMMYMAYAIPIFPIDVISILAGLTHLDYRRFIRIVALGLVTYTGIIAYVGATYASKIPHIERISVIAFIGVMGFFIWWVYKEFSK